MQPRSVRVCLAAGYDAADRRCHRSRSLLDQSPHLFGSRSSGVPVLLSTTYTSVVEHLFSHLDGKGQRPSPCQRAVIAPVLRRPTQMERVRWWCHPSRRSTSGVLPSRRQARWRAARPAYDAGDGQARCGGTSIPTRATSPFCPLLRVLHDATDAGQGIRLQGKNHAVLVADVEWDADVIAMEWLVPEP